MVDRASVVVGFGILFMLFNSTFQQSVVPLSSRIERVSLIQLRSSLGLRSRDWPVKADPCLVWVGVYCQNGRVIGINISGFKRTRIAAQNPQFAVDSLANFTLLASFNASMFLLPAPIPDWFGLSLISLQVLDLRSCSITGAIPSSFGNLTNLTSLYLSDNVLDGIIPSSFGQLSRLSVLDLSQNSLTGFIPLSFASLMNLTLLNMSSNLLSGIIPPAIGSLSKLQYLNLSSNNLSSSIPAQLGDLSSLVDLDLSSNSFSGSVSADLRGLRNLKKMVIGNNLLTGSLPGDLFPALTQLQFIFLNHNDFTGGLPDILWSMPELRFLDVSANNFTGTLPNINSNSNATAAVVNLSQNTFYGGLTSVLRRFNFIDLSGNYFEGMVPDYAPSNASLIRNCLRNLSTQRSGAECASFYNERGLQFDNFGFPNTTQPPPAKPSPKSHKNLIILAGVLGGVGCIAILVIVMVLLFVCTCKRSVTNRRGRGVGPIPVGGSSPPPRLSSKLSSLGEAFTYQQILQATDNFNDVNLRKHGHSGDLFQGMFEDGIRVVIKKIDLPSVKKEAYMKELNFFSKISHTRLVPLLGHCLENENEKYLVYKYMPNGDLSSSLYRKTNSEDGSLQSLDWITRLKIAIGAAEGLSYLHHECSPALVHRDVQASSILLDDKFEVRLGSLSEVCAQEGENHQSKITRLLRLPSTCEQGTFGSPSATCAYDVYCFGKVLLELVTGKLGISASSEAKMKDWLEEALPYISIYDKELVTNIVDPSLIVDEDLLEEVWAMAIVARSCLNPKPSRRPLMRYILKALESPLKVVREEHISSARLRTTSSRRSWNAALFESWRTSSSDVVVVPISKADGGGHYSSSTRRQSKEIFPEPSDEHDIERETK
ncbi:putative LRR receptor-like serine/threonine-protein kinase [Camellia lanceoleosa]|uniref:LRR receptor-like serine/threonine-protein kinase n=1 Tax=Camellia lanceoleosa TaxID=1840588 RepID=A0ACC0HQL6_9ERIC|nr:putative LRR receptor-like serine/threonine-protein kinase [Camellia lanceoleosa]